MEPFNNHQDFLHKLDNKLDGINEKIASIDRTLIEVRKDLEYHIARTDILEKEVNDIDRRMQPIESIRFTWLNIGKLIIFIAGVVGAVAAVLEAIKS